MNHARERARGRRGRERDAEREIGKEGGLERGREAERQRQTDGKKVCKRESGREIEREKEREREKAKEKERASVGRVSRTRVLHATRADGGTSRWNEISNTHVIFRQVGTGRVNPALPPGAAHAAWRLLALHGTG